MLEVKSVAPKEQRIKSDTGVNQSQLYTNNLGTWFEYQGSRNHVLSHLCTVMSQYLKTISIEREKGV